MALIIWHVLMFTNLIVTSKCAIFYYRDELEYTVSKYGVKWKVMHAFYRS